MILHFSKSGLEKEGRMPRIAALVAIFSLIVFPIRSRSEAENHSFLSLAIGIYTDEKMPEAPTAPELDGTFRRFMGVQWNEEKKTMRFFPKSPGVATFIVKNPATGKVVYEYTMDIQKTELEKVGREIQGLLQTIEGIQIKILGDKVTVDGEILLPSDMKRIHDVVKKYRDQADSLVQLSPISQNKIAQFMERKINNPEVRVSAANGKFILEGFTNSPLERDRAEIIAKMYLPDIIIPPAIGDKIMIQPKTEMVVNLITVRPPPESEPAKIIQMVVHFVEMEKDYNRSFNIEWMPELFDSSTIEYKTSDSASGGVGMAITGTISHLLPKLNWAKEHGFARVVQSESVIVEDGKSGIINATQNLPYQVVNAQGQPSTSFAEAGIRTNIVPMIMGARSDSVKLSIAFSVRSLLSYTPQGPLTSNREVQSILHLRSGQSAAVGGLVIDDSSTGFDKLSPNAPLNPLFTIKHSKDHRHNQSQFVVFVTPIIKSSASSGSEKIKRKFAMQP